MFKYINKFDYIIIYLIFIYYIYYIYLLSYSFKTNTIMMVLSPNLSNDQFVPFDDVRAASIIQEFHTIIDDDNVYSVMNYGSVQFVSEPSTSLQQQKTLTECIAHAHSQGKTKFVVFNGANDSIGKDGTTFTSSNWVENATNNYSENPKYNTMEFYCYGLAPHSTAHMNAVWMEEYGNIHTKTYIITLSAKERQKMLSIFGSKCSKVILNFPCLNLNLKLKMIPLL